MIEFDFTPHGVCSRNIHVVLTDDGNTIQEVSFLGGCDGNLKAIGKLLEGASVDTTIELLAGNTCGRKDTSCADQLTRALRQAQMSVQ